jgi:ATP-dependent RNA helicase DDX19/DBP5
MLLFSATYDAQVMKFAQAVVPSPIVIRLRREEESLDHIKQFFIRCNSLEDKFHALSNIYGAISIGQSMNFCHVGHLDVIYRLGFNVCALADQKSS